MPSYTKNSATKRLQETDYVLLDSRKSDYNHITSKRVRWSMTRVSRSRKCVRRPIITRKRVRRFRKRVRGSRNYVRRSCKTVWRSRKHVTRYKKRLYSYRKFT